MFKGKSQAVILAQISNQDRERRVSVDLQLLYKHRVTTGERFENYQKCSGMSSVVSLLDVEKTPVTKFALADVIT